MARGRGRFEQVVLVLTVMAAAFVGARLGLLGTQDAGASHNFNDVPSGRALLSRPPGSSDPSDGPWSRSAPKVRD